MNITGILIATAIVGGVGLFIGVFLGFAGKTFAVEVDEREEAINDVLPGNNCGGCGYAGCSGLAAAIVAGEAEINACPVGGTPVANQIGEIMGESVADEKPMTAFVKCGGTCEKATSDYEYTGVEDCVMMAFLPNGGAKSCNYGCLGYGTCMKACPFDAIYMEEGIAKVNSHKCKACKKCIAACPKQLIELVPVEAEHLVLCNSKDKGKDVMKVCSVGCIGCKMCEKVCEFDAIKVEDNIAHIDYDKCTNCGKCAEKCPKKTIL